MNDWQGPVESGLGLHLVKITERVEGSLPELADIRPIVEREWANGKPARDPAIDQRSIIEQLRSHNRVADRMTRTRALFVLIMLGLLPVLASAHEMRPGYLEIRETAPDTYDVLWKVPALGDDMRLGLYLRFEDDVRTVAEPVSGFIGSAHTQRMRIQRDNGLTGTTITIDGLDATYTDVLLRLERANGVEITHRLTPASPSYVVEAEPGRGPDCIDLHHARHRTHLAGR